MIVAEADFLEDCTVRLSAASERGRLTEPYIHDRWLRVVLSLSDHVTRQATRGHNRSVIVS
jgi:hypothetical protein